MPGLPDRDGVGQSPYLDHWSAHRTQPDTTKVFRSFPGAFGASRRLFYAATSSTRSLKTQQRSKRREPRF